MGEDKEQTPEQEHIDVQKAKDQVESYKDLVKRMQADFENYKKRYEKDFKDSVTVGKRDMIASLLPVIDSFELAVKNTVPNDKFADGMKRIYAQLLTILQANGLKRIECVGKKFDPSIHEVIMIEHSDKDGFVLEEFQSGYTVGSFIVRHAKVKIGKNDQKVVENG